MAAIRPVALLAAGGLLAACTGPFAGFAGITGGPAAGNGSLAAGNDNSGLVGNNTNGLVGNNAVAFAGTVSAPQALVSNNVAGLVSNNAGGLVSNNAGGLVGNNSNAYRIAGLEQVPASGALIYLTNPDEKFFSADGRVLSTTTDAAGRYELGSGLPEGQYVVVNAMLARNRRLVGFVVSRNGRNQVDIDIATTYVMEMFRSEARRAGKTFADYDLARVPDLVARTGKMLASGQLGLEPDRLIVGNSALLVDDYVAALAADREASAAWTALLGRKPVAISTLAGTYAFGFNSAGAVPGPEAPAFNPTAVAASQGQTFVAMQVMHQIVSVDEAGNLQPLTARTEVDPFENAAPPVPDNGAVTSATRIPQPIGLAADAAGSLYVTMNYSADAPRNVLLLINRDPAPKFGLQNPEVGKIYRIAGTPEARYDDSGFNAPAGLAADDAGNLFVADIQNDRIMRVSRASGMMRRVAGFGRGTTWAKVSDSLTRATLSALLEPVAVAWRRNGADEELYVLDSYNQRVRLVRAPGGSWDDATMRTIAGSGTPVSGAGAPVVSAAFGGDGGTALLAQFGFAMVDPSRWEASEVSQAGMALDGARNVLYVSDPVNRRVRAIDLTTGTVNTVAGGGTNKRDGLATAADLVSPAGLGLLPGGDLVVADRGAHAVRRVTLGE